MVTSLGILGQSDRYQNGGGQGIERWTTLLLVSTATFTFNLSLTFVLLGILWLLLHKECGFRS